MLENQLQNYIGKKGLEALKKISLFSGITCDSRKVNNNFIFVAIKGIITDGNFFISEAIKNGATVIVHDDEYIPSLSSKITFIRCSNIRKNYALLCKIKFNSPDEALKIIAITGTNGKTTTSYMIKNILEKSGLKVGMIGTIENDLGDEKTHVSNLTTPQAEIFYEFLAKMKNTGISHVVIELSSHALELDRLYGLSLDGLIFTNLTRDHLDFHKTMEEYFKAKTKSSQYLDNKENSFALINIDDKYGERILKNKLFRTSILKTYSLEKKEADYYIESLSQSNKIIPTQNAFRITTGTTSIDLIINMLGKYNLYNALASYASCQILGIEKTFLAQGLLNVTVSGRFQSFNIPNGGIVVVDFAHTDDALENLLTTIKEMNPKELTTLFGCGGDRDTSKRFTMGKVAAKYSSKIFITTDNPRKENPRNICEEIEKGVVEYGHQNYEIIINRKRAIELAMKEMSRDSVLVIAGKGHEQYQIIGNHKGYFSDQEIVKNEIKKINKNIN